VFSVVDRGEQAGPEKIGQLARIDAVILVAGFQQGVLPRVTHQHLRDMRFEQIVQPGGAGSFFQGHLQTTAHSVEKLQNRCRFGFEDGFHHQLASRVQHGRRDRCLMNIEPNILASFMRVLLPVGVEANNQNLLERGALL